MAIMVPTIEQRVPHRENRKRIGIILRAPFSRSFNDTLVKLPKPDRYFDDKRMGWWISEEQAYAAERIAYRYWPTIMFLGLDGGEDVMRDRDGSTATQTRLL